MEFADALDNVPLTRHDMRMTLGFEVPIIMLTDREELFRVLKTSRHTAQLQLKIDIVSV